MVSHLSKGKKGGQRFKMEVCQPWSFGRLTADVRLRSAGSLSSLHGGGSYNAAACTVFKKNIELAVHAIL
jgi:hypothetical protein